MQDESHSLRPESSSQAVFLVTASAPSTEELSSLPGYQPPVHRGSISNPPEPSASPHEPPSLINNYHRNAFPVSNVNQAFNPSPDNLPMLPQPSFSQIPFNPYLGTQPFAFPQGPYQSQQALPSHHQSQSPFLPSSAYTPYGAAIHGSPNPQAIPQGLLNFLVHILDIP